MVQYIRLQRIYPYTNYKIYSKNDLPQYLTYIFYLSWLKKTVFSKIVAAISLQ